MQVCPELHNALTRERLALREFIALLQQEQRLLTENDLEQLPSISEKKSASALGLNSLTETRRHQQEMLTTSKEVAVVQAWYQSNTPPCLALWLEIHELAGQAQQLNHTNGEVIQMKLRHNQQSLAALSRAVSSANLYGPDGQSSFTPGTGRSLGSV